MARVHGMAHAFWESVNWEIGDRPEWKLIFKQGWERNLRIGGYYAGHPKLSDLKEALNKQNVDTMSPGYGGGADGEESSSWKGPRGIEHHKRRGADEGDETPEPKRRKIIVAAMHQNNVDEDERTEMVYKQRAEKALRCGSPIQSKLASHLNHDHNSRALPGRRDRPLAALPSPREVFREKEVDFPRRSDASGRTSKVLSERTMTDDAADSFVLKCGDRLVSVTHLPICIGRTVSGGFGDQDIVLSGKFYGGRTKSYPVDMWKMVLRPGSEPRLLVKTTEGFWLRLLQPQPYYLKTFGDGYILAQFLHFVKERPSATAIELEKYLAKACSMYGQEPFLEKLTQHLRIIRSYVEEDGDLKSASVLRTVFPNIFTKSGKAAPKGRMSGSLQNPSELRGDLSQHSRQVLRSVLGLNGERSLQNERKADNIRQDMMWGNGLTRGESSAERYVPGKAFVDEGINPKRSGGNLRFELAASEDKKLKRHAPKLERERHDSGKNDRKKTSWLVGGSRLHSEESNGARAKDDRKISQRSQTEMKKLDDPPICIMCDDGGDLLMANDGIARIVNSNNISVSFATSWAPQTQPLVDHRSICVKYHLVNVFIMRTVSLSWWTFRIGELRQRQSRMVQSPSYVHATGVILVDTARVLLEYLSSADVAPKLGTESVSSTIACPASIKEIQSGSTMSMNLSIAEVVDNTRIKKIKFKASGMSSTIERQYCETLPPNSLAAELGLFDQ
ncbi:hypothetical protein AXG93_4491s1070 [Marchantia polymorpha subsp. ruderalis]|uniref:DNA (cytosine-5)-methyltransferase 1 replication foci domain-containing protein n=1 Tax=Marchantia polymorpha subsp. ruderalis TaxID=1480154 RepID=A0A176WQD6_MARPO|nr:hypothetical protein AXG93_4491s1070 [Marchantia polymorpha subsp. ruderalis]